MSIVNPAEVIAEALSEHHACWATAVLDYSDMDAVSFQGCSCNALDVTTEEAHAAHQASVIAALPNIAIMPVSGCIEVITHALNGDLIARRIDTSRHIAIAHIGSQPHSFANAPEALALKAEAYAALAAARAGGES